VLQRAKRCDVEGGNTPGQGEHALAFGDPQRRQNIGKAITLFLQVAIGQIAYAAVLAQPTQGQVVASCTIGMPVDCLMGHIQAPPAGQAVEVTSHGLPRERGVCLVVIQEVGR
jgi:hypothetical protein